MVCENFVMPPKLTTNCLLRGLVFGIVVFALSTAPLTTKAASADEPTRDPSAGLAISVGHFDVLENDRSTEAGVEYRFPKFSWWRLDLNPVIGFSAAEEGNYWGYGGLRWDIPSTSDRFVTTLGFAIALYEDGDGKNLGGEVEFRSSIDVAYQLRNGQRVGLSLYHLSNGRLYSFNPGSESLVLTWSFGRPR